MKLQGWRWERVSLKLQEWRWERVRMKETGKNGLCSVFGGLSHHDVHAGRSDGEVVR
jgi:hypothetical protein